MRENLCLLAVLMGIASILFLECPPIVRRWHRRQERRKLQRYADQERAANTRLLRLADGNHQLEVLLGLREEHESAQYRYGG